jgi:hypothetical protein
MIPIPPWLLPWLWKHKDIIIVALAVLFVLGWVYHKGGSNVRADITDAVNEQKDEARKEIVKTEKKYEAPLNKINAAAGDAPAGPLTSYALSVMPRPSVPR